MHTGLKPNNPLEAERLALSRAITSDFVIPSKPDSAGFMDFQRAGVEYATKTKNLLQADPPGVGKTIQTIGFMNARGITRALILCPAALLYNWARELKAWHAAEDLRVEIFNPKKFNPLKPPDVLIMSYGFAGKTEQAKKVIGWGRYRLCVLDECQYLKNPNAKRTKITLAKNGLISKAEYVHALSGTPLVNRPMELFPILTTLCPEAIGGMSMFEFGLEFCGGWKAPWGWEFSGASNLQVLGMKLRSNFMVRRKKKDILPQLPEKFPPNIVYLEPSRESKNIVKAMSVFDEDAIKGTVPQSAFEELSTARKELGLLKVDKASAYIAEQIDAGRGKVLVFAHHVEVIERLSHNLNGFGVVKIIGGMSPKEKDDAVRKFQEDPTARVALLSIQAAGVGITLTASDYVCFVEFSWVPGENEQAIDRTHRIGQTKGVVIDYLVFENSLEERMLKYLWKKQKVFDEVFQ